MPADGAFSYILKTLEDAERDGDKIYGVIRGVHITAAGPEAGLYRDSVTIKLNTRPIHLTSS